MAFTDLHEIEEMFGRLEGQTAGLSKATKGGGYYVCHAPDSDLGRARAEYKRKWMAEQRKKRGWRAMEKRLDPEARKASGRKKDAAYRAKLRAFPGVAPKLKEKEYQKAYRAANKEKINARRRVWLAKRDALRPEPKPRHPKPPREAAKRDRKAYAKAWRARKRQARLDAERAVEDGY